MAVVTLHPEVGAAKIDGCPRIPHQRGENQIGRIIGCIGPNTRRDGDGV